MRMDEGFFQRGAGEVARDLLGCELIRGERRGIIVETEAYLDDDPGSHAYRGRTERNASMYLAGGHAYVYRIYGIHHCFNVVTGEAGRGEAVLIRSCEPLDGLEEMRRDRWGDDGKHRERNRIRELCNGPGKLCAAFGISRREHDGVEIGAGELVIRPGIPVGDGEVGSSPRIGLGAGRGQDSLYRWFVAGSRFLSR